jgi:predicted phosphate transport protein (TIGR00153 family)
MWLFRDIKLKINPHLLEGVIQLMLKRLLPRQDNFLKLFQQAAEKLHLAAVEFSNLLQNLQNQQHYVDAIARHEEEADEVAYTNFELLHKTFITPFDRNDIHQLTSTLDDILDLINRIAQRFPFYKLESVPEEMIQLSHLSAEATKLLKDAISCLHSLKNSEAIFQLCKEIDRVESRAHKVVLAGEKKLFETEEDFKRFFKLKEIYAHTKLVINRCQDVGNIIKGIILEYS